MLSVPLPRKAGFYFQHKRAFLDQELQVAGLRTALRLWSYCCEGFMAVSGQHPLNTERPPPPLTRC